ncbi:hypothetical protein [Mucilaginibacter pedocola]|uniref:DUF481 domain-containing protein n=1 Tax=Mucilaginibacter pedocola TaxID=1792845 RepID=A0A1S9PDX2_9SPHI|nr:hypothetical protein [Mucilaginibacter pedocola]OOQ59143.1 hypothetical protein BC343_29420 [Mucilaginibacter pedocola]
MIHKRFNSLVGKIALGVCLGLVIPAFCHAQQAVAYKPTAALTFSNAAIKDAGMSALTYTGWFPGAAIGLDINSKTLMQNISLGYAGGNLKNEFNPATVSHRYYSANYTALVPLMQGKLRFDVGGVFNNALATRKHSSFNNNNKYFEFNSSVGPAVQLSYLFGNDGGNGNNADGLLSFRVFSPLLTALSRSNSVYNQQNAFLSPRLSTYLKNTRIVTFGRYAKVNLHTQFDNRAGVLKGLSVAYNWEYYKISESNAVQSAVNTVSLSYHF